jgi:hypothetical protein
VRKRVLANPIRAQMTQDGPTLVTAANHTDVADRRIDHLPQRGFVGNMISRDQDDETICVRLTEYTPGPSAAGLSTTVTSSQRLPINLSGCPMPAADDDLAHAGRKGG